jgi:hypothetical protein
MIPWLGAFLFTQVVECPIYAASLRQRPGSWSLRFAIAFGASAITHPVVWFVIPWLWYRFHLGRLLSWLPWYDGALGYAGGYWGMVVLAEVFAVGVEGLYLRRVHPARSLAVALAWALGANLASVSLGFASRAFFGWP